MRPVEKNYHIYQNVGYWFLLFILLVLAGFYTTYFAVLFESTISIIHIHFVLMALWIGLLITQPFLIKYKKYSTHRLLGKLSYVLVPLMLLVAFLMMRYGYHAFMDRISQGATITLSAAEVRHLAARNNALPFFYFVWLTLFYGLAIGFRKHPSIHARYMVAAALTIIGPTVDRILYFLFHIQVLPLGVPLETFAFLLIDLILIVLLIRDVKEKVNAKPLWVALSVYTGSQACYFLIQDTNWWEVAMTLMMS